MNRILMTIAAAAIIAGAGLPTSTPAAAGGGVKLQFGFPLGSFVARPSRGGYSDHSHASRSGHADRKAAAARKAAAERKAAAAARREAAAREAAAKKAQAAEEKRAAARLAARREAIAAKRAETAAAARRAKGKAAAEDEVVETISRPAPVKASAIAGANTLIENENAAAATSGGEGVPSPEGDTKSAPKVSKVEKVAKVAEVEREVETPVAEETAERSLGCRKYIPSAGLTINVPCAD